jgi:hypothetical protein
VLNVQINYRGYSRWPRAATELGFELQKVGGERRTCVQRSPPRLPRLRGRLCRWAAGVEPQQIRLYVRAANTHCAPSGITDRRGASPLCTQTHATRPAAGATGKQKMYHTCAHVSPRTHAGIIMRVHARAAEWCWGIGHGPCWEAPSPLCSSHTRSVSVRAHLSRYMYIYIYVYKWYRYSQNVVFNVFVLHVQPRLA